LAGMPGAIFHLSRLYRHSPKTTEGTTISERGCAGRCSFETLSDFSSCSGKAQPTESVRQRLQMRELRRSIGERTQRGALAKLRIAHSLDTFDEPGAKTNCQPHIVRCQIISLSSLLTLFPLWLNSASQLCHHPNDAAQVTRALRPSGGRVYWRTI
jgi:hypothetical protein